MPVSSNHYSIVAGVKADLADTWDITQPNWDAQANLFCRTIPESSIRNLTEAWKESTPFPRLWPTGKSRVVQNFKDIYLTLGKWNYELTVSWSRWDEEDDQIGDLRTRVMSAVNRYRQLLIALISEYLNNNASLNPAILNAYDGASLFSATDGDGNSRLGVSGGNLITGNGSTADGIIHDYMTAYQRLLTAVDPTAGKPIFSQGEVDPAKFKCIIPPALAEIFLKVAESKYLKIAGENMVSEDNFLTNKIGKLDWEVNPWLTDTSDWYLLYQHPQWKPFVLRAPTKPKAIVADDSNSDHARETGEYMLNSDVRAAVGPYMPMTLFRVNN